jgi:acyl carrier protein
MNDVAGGRDYVDEVTALVCATFRLPSEQVERSTPFDELGVNSRRRVRLLATVETHFGISIGVDVLDRFVDVNGVAAVVAEAVARRDAAS